MGKPISYDIVAAPIIITRLTALDNAKADCIIISDNTPYSVSQQIKDVQTYIHNCGNIFVLFQARDQNSQVAFKQQKKTYAKVNFIEINSKKEKTKKITSLLQNEYVLLLDDQYVLAKDLDCNRIIKQLEQTFAYAWYGKASSSSCIQYNIPYQHIIDNLFAWKFNCDPQHHIPIHNCKLTLYRKKHVIGILKKNYSNVQQIINCLQAIHTAPYNVGLFYD